MSNILFYLVFLVPFEVQSYGMGFGNPFMPFGGGFAGAGAGAGVFGNPMGGYQRQPDGFPFGGFDFNPFNFATNLGQEISDVVSRSLEPLATTMAQTAMSRGVGGVTIVTIRRTGLQFLMYEGSAFACNGQIVKKPGAQPTCTGNLMSVLDLCVPGQNFMQQNDVRCYGQNVSMMDGNCLGGIRATLADLKARCGPDFDTDNYAYFEYYPTAGKMGAVDIIKSDICENATPSNFCAFTGF